MLKLTQFSRILLYRIFFFNFLTRGTNLFCHIICIHIRMQNETNKRNRAQSSDSTLQHHPNSVGILQFSWAGCTDSSGAMRRRRIYCASWIHLRIFASVSLPHASQSPPVTNYVARRCKYLDLNLIYSYTQNVIHLRYLYVAVVVTAAVTFRFPSSFFTFLNWRICHFDKADLVLNCWWCWCRCYRCHFDHHVILALCVFCA